jgi:Spy/CpxP family protein refolding chaperone
MAGIGLERDFTSLLQYSVFIAQALPRLYTHVQSFRLRYSSNTVNRQHHPAERERKEQQIVKTRIAILIGIVALIAGGVVFAAHAAQDQGQRMRREGGPPPPPPPVPDVESLSRALGLSEAQTAELKPFLDAQHATMDTLRQKLDDTRQQIQAATKDGQFDEAQVRTLAAQHAQAMTDLLVEQERVKAKIYNTLTPEQRTKAEQLHRHGPGPGGPRGRGPGGPGMPPPPPPKPDN